MTTTIAKYGLALAAREHLVAGQPITRLEALVLFGVANLPDLIKEMRRQGWVIESRWVPYATAVRRINQHAVLQPPANLPVREIQLMEYWVKT
jgi:hypothetical protein